ncbi:MAG: site-2 protease family protein [Ignavibacteria bacterium]|nr:site-2 protease family protein [Ignavibacteria bacterium]
MLTFGTTTLAGVQWLNKDPFELGNFFYGLPYSLSLLAFLSAHEFGHYFAARYHRVATTLPFFIPVPPFLVNPFGTMGAVIRIRSPWPSKKALFDIGIAGPIAGFVVTVAILLYGLMTLPGKEFLYSIHPDYRGMAKIPTDGLTFGTSIFFWGIAKLCSQFEFIPPMSEIYHYPYLCVGWFGLFVTALNLIPVGQLDGGHILYALLGGDRHGKIARIFFFVLILFGVTSFIPLLGMKISLGTSGWLLWAIILYFIVKLDHPPIVDDEKLGAKRRILGWITMGVFVFTFVPFPFIE